MVTREEALAKLDESRRALLRAVEGFSEEQMAHVQVEGVWTAKDVLGHVASWDRTIAEPLQRYAEGGVYDVEVLKDYLAWNEEEAARKRDMSLEAVMEELTAVRQNLIAAASSLPTEKWRQQLAFSWGAVGTVADALEGLAVHEMEHAHAIRQWSRRNAR